MSKPVRITVAEPSVIIRKGILAILKQFTPLQLEVFEVAEMEQLKNALVCRKPDILMISPAFGGVFSLQQLKKDANIPHAKCVALQFSLTDHATLKNYDEVISLYDTAEQIKEKLTQLIHAPESDKRHESLSLREKEIIVLVIKGMTNKQIADALCISAHTVLTHRRNISSKLQIRSVAGLTIYAIVNKMVELDEVKNISDS